MTHLLPPLAAIDPTMPDALLRGYLVGWLFCLGIALGSLSVLALHHLTGGVWGWPLRRPAEAAAMTLPGLAVAAVPLMLGAGRLFPWADAHALATEALVRHRAVLFSPPLVLGRWVLFLLVWTGFAFAMRRLSLGHDRTGDPALLVRSRSLAAAWIVVHFVTMSLAAVDWVASREVDWYSSTFGLVTVVGQAATAIAFLVAFTAARHGELLERSGEPQRVAHDWGNLLQTVVVLWAYISFAQFLVIWVGNTQEDVTWFFHRNQGGWRLVTVSLVVLHFGLPFVLLLFQAAKRRPGRLAAVAGGVLLMRAVDVVWMVVPSAAGPDAATLAWPDVVIPLIGFALWMLGFTWVLRRRTLVPAAWDALHPAETEVGHGHPARD